MRAGWNFYVINSSGSGAIIGLREVLQIQAKRARVALVGTPYFNKINIKQSVTNGEGKTTKGLRFLVLGQDGQYATVSRSRSFPFVDVTSVATALQAAEKIGETQSVRQFLDQLPSD